MLDDVKILVFGDVQCVLKELRCAGIERIGQHPVWTTNIAMATRAIGLIDLHTHNQIGIRVLNWIRRF